ncbi:PAS domain S-box protein [Halonotius sp. F2-221B]|uniref:PAS domain-containing sensor histidine kinase n=1 Tax=Halonotius sp. F2-221B TaxID=2731620 RepID=UPI00398AAA3A
MISNGTETEYSGVCNAICSSISEPVCVFAVKRSDTAHTFVVKNNNTIHSKQTGVDIANGSGQPLDDLLDADAAAALRHPLEDCLDHAEPVERTETISWPAATVSWETTYTPVVQDGTVERIVATSQEVPNSPSPDSQQPNQEVTQLTERLKLAVEGAGIGVWDWDMTTDQVEYNEQWASMLGYTLDDIEPHLSAWESRTHPDDAERIKTALENHEQQATEYYDTEHRMKTASGDWKWIRDIGTIVERDADDDPIRAVGIHIDIDQQKTAQQGLEAEREMFKQGPAVVFRWDDDAGWPIKYVSENVKDTFGYTPAELQSTAFVSLVHDEDVQQVREAFSRERKTDQELVTLDPYRIRDADGNTRWVKEYTNTAPDNPEDTSLVGYLIDITEQKENQRELEAREQKYRNLFEHNRDALMLMDREGYLDCNEQTLELFGIDSVEEFVTHAPGELSPTTQPDGRPSQEAASDWIDTAFESGEAVFEWVHQRADGTEFPAEVKLTRFEYNDRSAVHALVRDITERKQRARSLEISEAKYRSLFEDSRDALMLLDRDGFFDCNEQALELFDIESVEAFTEYTPWELAPQSQPDGRDSKAIALEHIEKAFNEGTAFFEWIHQRGDGTEFAAEVKLSRFEHQGEPAVHAIVRDISARKEREQQLKQFQKAVEQTGHAVYMTETDGNIEYINPAFESITGYNKAEAIGRKPSILKSGEHSDDYYDELWETILAGDQWEAEVIDERANGEEVVLNQTVSPLTDEEGTPEKFVAVANDITQRKSYERQLEEQRDNLDILNQVLRHDIRNDLQLILAYTEMVADAIDHEEAETHLQTVYENAEHAVDLTTVAREMAAVMLSAEQELEPISIRSVVRSEIEQIREAYPDANIISASEIQQVSVRANKMLGSVFRNLLKNAVQHNDKPVPTVAVSSDTADGSIRIRVADNGPGISDAAKEDIFGKGEKGLDSEGTGIGLYLVKSLVDSYGGDVWIEDRNEGGIVDAETPTAAPSEGAVFVVELPTVQRE